MLNKRHLHRAALCWIRRQGLHRSGQTALFGLGILVWGFGIFLPHWYGLILLAPLSLYCFWAAWWYPHRLARSAVALQQAATNRLGEHCVTVTHTQFRDTYADTTQETPLREIFEVERLPGLLVLALSIRDRLPIPENADCLGLTWEQFAAELVERIGQARS